MKETLYDKVLDISVNHFFDLIQEMTNSVDKDTISKLNDEITKTRIVLREIKRIFSTPTS